MQEKVKFLYAGISNQSKFDDLFNELVIEQERSEEANSLRKKIAELKEREKFQAEEINLLQKNIPDKEKFAALNHELDLAKKKAVEAESLSKLVEDLQERSRLLDDISGVIPKEISDKDDPAERVSELLNR